MLKEFWEKKKHLIQLVGILTGVGALFLAISPPENVDARQALANIQFMWLVVITLSCSTLFISFHSFSIDLEKQLGSKWGIDLKETVSLFIILSLVYFLTNLWTYIFSLYSSSVWDFLQGTNMGIMALLGAFFFHYFWRIAEKIKKYRDRIFFMIGAYLLISALVGFLSLLMSHKGLDFPLWQWLLVSGVIFIFMVVMTVYEANRRGKGIKKDESQKLEKF